MTNFHGDKEKQNSKRKFKMADSKKLSLSKPTNAKYFLTKISWIGLWISRINWCQTDWCKGHWCVSTYMVVRLSNIRSKTGNFFWKTQFFWVGNFEFLFLWWFTAKNDPHQPLIPAVYMLKVKKSRKVSLDNMYISFDAGFERMYN